MAKTNAQHQADWRQRQRDEVVSLRAEVERLRLAARHTACDVLEKELRAEIARLKGQVRF